MGKHWRNARKTNQPQWQEDDFESLLPSSTRAGTALRPVTKVDGLGATIMGFQEDEGDHRAAQHKHQCCSCCRQRRRGRGRRGCHHP